MKTLGKIAIGFVAFIVGVVVLYKGAYPTYTHRYRLTLAIEADGQVHTGSSVIEVSWIGQPKLGQAPPFDGWVRGQAALVDLGNHRAIVAALHPTLPTFDSDRSVSAKLLAIRAFALNAGLDSYRLITQQKGRRDLTPDNMPLLLWFSDISDPETARPIKPDEIPVLLGPNSRLVAAYVEMTDDPVRVDLDKRLGWFRELKAKQNSGLFVGYPGRFYLMHSMLVGEG